MRHSDDAGKKQGTGHSALPPEESEKRSWVQKRMCQIYMDLHGISGVVDNDKWATCYREAEREWHEREENSPGG